MFVAHVAKKIKSIIILMMTQLFNVNGRWLNRERMLKARKLGEYSNETPVQEPVKEVPQKEEPCKEECDKECSVEELRALCDEKGIKYHHKTGEKKLKTLLGIEE